MSVLHHPGPYGLSELLHGTHVCHGVGALKDKRLGRFPLKIDFSTVRRHGCVNIAPQCMSRRLIYGGVI